MNQNEPSQIDILEAALTAAKAEVDALKKQTDEALRLHYSTKSERDALKAEVEALKKERDEARSSGSMVLYSGVLPESLAKLLSKALKKPLPEQFAKERHPRCLTCKREMTEDHPGEWFCWECDADDGKKLHDLTAERDSLAAQLQQAREERDVEARKEPEAADIERQFTSVKEQNVTTSYKQAFHALAERLKETKVQLHAARSDNDTILAQLSAANEQVQKLQAFKDWVHGYLDAHAVPHHPPGTHGAEGCRIGDRMDWLMKERDAYAKGCESAKRDANEWHGKWEINQAEKINLREQLQSLRRTLEDAGAELSAVEHKFERAGGIWKVAERGVQLGAPSWASNVENALRNLRTILGAALASTPASTGERSEQKDQP